MEHKNINKIIINKVEYLYDFEKFIYAFVNDIDADGIVYIPAKININNKELLVEHLTDNFIHNTVINKRITKFIVDKNNNRLKSINNLLYYIDHYDDFLYSVAAVPSELKLKEINLPKNIKNVDLSRFNSNDYIKRVYINYDNNFNSNIFCSYKNKIKYLKEIIINNNLLIKNKDNRFTIL